MRASGLGCSFYWHSVRARTHGGRGRGEAFHKTKKKKKKAKNGPRNAFQFYYVIPPLQFLSEEPMVRAASGTCAPGSAKVTRLHKD